MHRIKEGCPGCGNCLNICPVQAIIPDSGLGMMITDNCIDCGVCVGSCPVKLIEAAPIIDVPIVAEKASTKQRKEEKEADLNA